MNPQVVDDQFGRLTFAEDLAAGIWHLVQRDAPSGTYNLSNTGPVTSWADIAAEVFTLRGRSAADVVRVSAAEFAVAQARNGRHPAPRPRHSTLTLHKLGDTGFEPAPAQRRLREYLSRAT